MNPKRLKTTEFICNYIGRIAGPENKKLIKDTLNNMSDSEFDTYMKKLRDNTEVIPVVRPTGSSSINFNVANNIEIARELGYSFEQHVTYKGSGDLPDIKSPIKQVVLLLPFRRAAQLGQKGISVSHSAKKIDPITGQVTGDSQAVKLTLPEIQLANGMNIPKAISELLSARGGDSGKLKALEVYLSKQGSVTGNAIDEHATGIVSKDTLNAYMGAMHYKSNI